MRVAKKCGSVMQHLMGWGILAVCFLLLAGCQSTGRMDTQPYNRPLSASDFFPDGRSARDSVAGTVPQTDQRVDDPAVTGKDGQGNFVSTPPVPVNNDLISRGQERFGIYCTVCHGVDGHANGKAIQYGFPKPPDLLEEEAKALPDGKIFDIISNGQGNMLSYAYRVKPPDRWAIIAYLRAMQLKNGHLTQPLTPAELQQLEK
jgi:mono/diheme cytochrome c family protein